MSYTDRLSKKFPELDIFCFDEIDSTNNEAKRRILSGEVEKSLFVSNSQTNGRGRMGRSFFSPPDTGIYLSFAFSCPNFTPDFVRLTSQSAVAAAEAIDYVANIFCKIKWVNDIYLNDKKIAGILTESVISDKPYIIIGIGINTSTKSFPDELSKTAGSLDLTDEKKALLTEKLCENILYFINNPSDTEYISRYRRRSSVLGRRITYIKNSVTYKGTAVMLTDEAHLVVKRDDGTDDVLKSGEISLRTE